MSDLTVVMYHYVRDLPNTAFPRIKGLMLDEFRSGIDWLASNFEMCTLEAALAFIDGTYHPARRLCLLTFDDGLREHYTDVMPVLAERRIQGLFGVITSCVEERRVASVHMNHFLTAALDFDEYRSAFLRQVEALSPGALVAASLDEDSAQRSYPLDTRPMASFKMLVNFLLPAELRDAVIRALFAKYLGDERQFAAELYMTWEEVRALQANGMLVAGHTHRHLPLSTLTPAELESDLNTNRKLLDLNVHPQALWPFSYPYGKRNSYSGPVIAKLKEKGFHCGFDTEHAYNVPGSDWFTLHRIDCNGALRELAGRIAA